MKISGPIESKEENVNRRAQGFEMKNYGKESCFASFLPGIAGTKGIPIWSFYVNRGQAICSFGVENKDHAIMEFSPAHVAYRNVKRTGFRTFLRRDGKFAEAFHNENNPHTMTVGMNTLDIAEELKELELELKVSYFVLPEENVGGLVRMVSITNKGAACRLEAVDGMPEVFPYGVSLEHVKNMTQTAKAWMQAEDADKCLPYYRVRASIEDTATVTVTECGYFAVGTECDGSRMTPVVDPEALFGYDNSLENPVIFAEGGVDAVLAVTQNTSNLVPSAFFVLDRELSSGETVCFTELIGQVERKEILNEYVSRNLDKAYYTEKHARAESLAEELTKNIETSTGNARFDDYCRYTYMDNVLRGGYPVKLGHNKIFYTYSRKHGDIERDYNYFAMGPEFFSQGNGNFRDVNQNRRLDSFFSPFVGRENIKLFYSLIQLDGYNPLSIEKINYTLDPSKAAVILEGLEPEKKDELTAYVTKPFYPGGLYRKLMDTVSENDVEPKFTAILDFADKGINAVFGEGYWSDHWDYNLDLVEEYLSVFPEKEEEMLYEKDYTFFLSQININKRAKRYALTENGVRQHHALNKDSARKTADKLVRGDFGKGETVKTTLMGKLILLCAAKFAALDPYGMGVEMEGGRPGWYDALNGMPSLLGSSMAETYELARMLDYTIAALNKYPCEVELIKELAELICELDMINGSEELTEAANVSFWNRVNDVKEAYREKVYEGISGAAVTMKSCELAKILAGFRKTVGCGIEKAMKLQKCPTYFTYEVTDYKNDEEGIHPLAFTVKTVPMFLEGPVRAFKLGENAVDKKEIYNFVKNSELYDEKLKMYKINMPLAGSSYELGRCLAFTPGWLENESIWLHMEYKYLLELIRSGMYEEFLADFKNAVVPFLDEKTYGRSTLENSSFIASSKNPNPKIHGKGFVARLSGSTIEFMHMWKIMMFGKNPFCADESGNPVLRLNPSIPAYLVGEERRVSAMFLGSTKVTYVLPDRNDFIPGGYNVESIALRYESGACAQIAGEAICGQQAKDVREGRVAEIEVRIVR